MFVPVAAVQEMLSVMDSRGQQLSAVEEVKLQVNFDPDNLSTKSRNQTATRIEITV